MRIIAGTAKGRTLRTPARGTRPLIGRAREALFSSIGSALPGARVLDLFAGSGSLGLEALSRGAESAVFVERDRAAIDVLQRNVDAVGLGGEVVRAAAGAFLLADDRVYDLVFVDPPFAMAGGEVDGVLAAIGSRLAADGILVVHRRFDSASPHPDFPADEKVRRYGDSRLHVYRRTG